MIGDWSFLKARRFWALILLAIVGVLKSEGIIPEFIAQGLMTILTGFIAVRTVDRAAENFAGEIK
jgi:hypothetical protein